MSKLDNLNEFQYNIWKNKYQFENETMEQWLDRVSNNNSKLREVIVEGKFLFGGRILANRGLQHKGKKVTYSNCYVLAQPEDNIESIFDTAKKLARTFSYGGGVGIDISKLRPKGSKVNNAAITTTGAISFMDLYNITTDIIGQKGRRGALMVSMDVNHPDIEDFINIKTDLNKINKANISVKVDNKFMEAVQNNSLHKCMFVNQETGEKTIRLTSARELFETIAKNNWDYAEPGILFWDTIKEDNFLSNDPDFEYAGVNPCAEEPLPAGGSCLLGSINLSEFVKNPFTKDAFFDCDEFRRVIDISVRALNDVLDEGLELHPLQEQRESVRDYRQIGLGVMGIADMLIKLGMTYGSRRSLVLCDEVASCFLNESVISSSNLAKEKGTYPKYREEYIVESNMYGKLSREAKAYVEQYGLRNSQLLTIPPTGSISNLIGTSSGIEPIFSVSYTRKTESLHDEEKYYKVYTPIVEQLIKAQSIKDESELPREVITSMEILPTRRLRMQSVWQNYIDASISSTINLPNSATVDDVCFIYTQAWELGLKGVTVYRDGCKRGGILTVDKKDNKDIIEDNKELCKECGETMVHTGGCSHCPNCGFGEC